MNGKIVAFSSPSGGGKTTICRLLLEKHPDFILSVSATTRPPRPNEIDGKDYYFYTRQQFEEKIAQGGFLEYENVHGNLYGTLLSEIEKGISENKVILFDVDVNGALAIKEKFPEAVLIFIKPPTIDELKKRLMSRETENQDHIEKRLERIKLEYESGKDFDYTVINDHLEHALKAVENIIFNR